MSLSTPLTLHHPRPSRPSTPALLDSPHPSRPPTRSEKLLRDALRKNEERALSPNPSSRRPAPAPKSVNTSPKMRATTIPVPSSPRLRRMTTSPNPTSMTKPAAYAYLESELESCGVECNKGYGGDGEFESRDRSPSPTLANPKRVHARRASNSFHGIGSPSAYPNYSQNAGSRSSPTPHEMVLRSRLKEVLNQARTIEARMQSTSPSPREARSHSGSSRKRRSSSSTAASSSSSERPIIGTHSKHQAPPSPPHSKTSLSPSSLKPVPSFLEQQQREREEEEEEEIEALTTPINSPLTEDRKGKGVMLTPPPTPPPPSSTPFNRSKSDPLPRSGLPSPDLRAADMLSVDPRYPGTFADKPQFNARTASAQLRSIEGYVSFASVEGLGAPENLDFDDDDGQDDANANGARGRGLWNLLSRRRT